MITISNVSHAIGEVEILKDISLSIPKGKITALVGPNGAGKSTLLSLIARLQSLQTGTIHIDDLDVTTTPSDEMARKLAILAQSNMLTSRLSLYDLVSFGRFPHHKGRPNANDRAIVEQAIKNLDLEDLSDRFLDELSGGQRQKAFVAMAYAQDTDYLLLDEPLNNLDMSSARALMQRLKKLTETTGKTIVVVIHEINYAAIYADWIVGLRNGKLVVDGAKDEILTSQSIESIFDFQADIKDLDGKKLVLHYG